MLHPGSRRVYNGNYSTVTGKFVTWIHESGLMWNTLVIVRICLWCLGCDRKNLWLGGLWELQLNSMNGCPLLLQEGLLLHWKLVLNEWVGPDANNLLLLSPHHPCLQIPVGVCKSELLVHPLAGWTLACKGVWARLLCAPSVTTDCIHIWSLG